MKFLKNCVRFLIIVLFLPTLCVSHDKKIVIPRSLKIRVLLKEYNTKDNPSFSIATHGGVELQSVPESKKGCVFTRKHINVQVKNNEMYFQEKDSRLGKATKKEIVLIPKKRIITINDITCQGHLILKIDEKKHKLYVINSLDIDDYVYSVLRYESYQSWPLEMQKVQAVVSRTYALHCMMHNKKNAKLPYDVKNNNFHQRYMGVHEY